VLKALKDVGYETPSAIQAATIPPLLAGRDVLGTAQTGTGKTAAFALPILSQLDLAEDAAGARARPHARARAAGVRGVRVLRGHLRGVHVLPVYGGQGYGQQLSALRRGVHIVVGTPGRIMDHLDKGTLDLSELRFLVLDEADEMLKMGFAEDVETILADTPAGKQVALFSATMPAQIRRLAGTYLKDAEEINVKAKTSTATNITQRYLIVSYPQKVDALTRILEVENFEGMIVFTRTKNETETLAEKLRARGYAAAAINGDVAQAQRERTVNQLKDGKLDILVATDVAARGLDVERISHVVNFDLPIDTESYVHRIGRTGRAGRSGDAISFVTPRERRMLASIEKATRQPSPRCRCRAPTTSTRRASPASTTPSRRRSPRPSASTASATSSTTTSPTTTCPRRMSRRRSPSSHRGDPAAGRGPARAGAPRTVRARRSRTRPQRPRPRRPAPPRRSPSLGRPDRDLPHRGRSSAQGRAASDRGSARQ
jgi:ATP-dependent RNA helicase DeaD